jgi:hypothetical protein
MQERKTMFFFSNKDNQCKSKQRKNKLKRFCIFQIASHSHFSKFKMEEEKKQPMKKKKVGGWFNRDIEEWDMEDCFAFFGMSETTQKKLPKYRKAGPAKEAALRRMKELIEEAVRVPKLLSVECSGLDINTIVNTLNMLLHLLKQLKPEFAHVRPMRTGILVQINEDVQVLWHAISTLAYPPINTNIIGNNNVVDSTIQTTGISNVSTASTILPITSVAPDISAQQIAYFKSLTGGHKAKAKVSPIVHDKVEDSSEPNK